jgi:hypothetical protein
VRLPLVHRAPNFQHWTHPLKASEEVQESGDSSLDLMVILDLQISNTCVLTNGGGGGTDHAIKKRQCQVRLIHQKWRFGVDEGLLEQGE